MIPSPLKTIILSVLLLISVNLYSQKRTVSGYVSDAASKEILIGASVVDGRSGRGATTNAYGYYSLTLPDDASTLSYSFLGYEGVEQSLAARRDTVINIALAPIIQQIGEVVVTAHSGVVEGVRTGEVAVPISRIRNTPVIGGESDLMKSLQYIPGVQGTTEGKSDLSVRGGGPDQNLVLLDGNPIYNVNHLFGFLSIFNTDALKNVTLYKSGFPARFGGRLSSVVDINTRDGNKERFGGSASLGLLAGKFSIEGPIVKNRTSFTLSGRRSWADAFMGKLQDKKDGITTFYFYDVNAKVHHRFSERTSLWVSAYNGHDRLKNTLFFQSGKDSRSEDKLMWKWGNMLVAARLGTSLGSNLFMNANLSYNRYRYNSTLDNKATITENNETHDEKLSVSYDSGIRDYTGSLEFEYIPTPNHYIRMGAQYVYHNFRPEVVNLSGRAKPRVRTIGANELSLYVEDDWSVARRLKLNFGARVSMFNVEGKSYRGIDPRVSARMLLTDRMSVKAGYTRMQQYIHLLSSNSAFFQTDLWVPATRKVKPTSSTQYSLGYYITFPKLFDVSVEGYYKDMRRVIEYRDGATFVGSSSGWEDKVVAGKGRSYGLEIALERRVGRTTGSVAYSWSKTERRFDEINDGEWFPAKYDRRHSFNISVTQQLGKKVDVTASWIFSSGEMMTLPLMTGEDPQIPDAPGGMEAGNRFDHRNNFRKPSYHRLDLGVNFYPRKARSPRRYGVWNLSVYNAYNHMNAFLLYTETDTAGNPRLMQRTMFPILPSVSYTYNF